MFVLSFYLCEGNCHAASHTDNVLLKRQFELQKKLGFFNDYRLVKEYSYELTKEEINELIPIEYLEAENTPDEMLKINDGDCTVNTVIKPGESKVHTWSCQKKYPTGLPGYKWSWGLTVYLIGNNAGDGYIFDYATYTISESKSYLELAAMDYLSYNINQTAKSCTHSVSSKKVTFNVSVTYDISYVLRGQSYVNNFTVTSTDSYDFDIK